MKKDSDNERPEYEPQRRVTLRDIARELGISHVTVSAALRNRSGVSEETKARVLKKAEERGYVPDPMLAALSHYRQTSKEKPAQAALAWLNLWPNPEELRQYREFDLYFKGATDTARRLGFHLEEFITAEMSPHRLATILKTRNIQGILIPPISYLTSKWKEFPWADFAIVRFGRTHPYPEAHFVTSAQTANTILAFNKAQQLGYQRIGFVCESLSTRFFGVGFSWAQKNMPTKQQVPLLTLSQDDNVTKQQNVLKNWIKKNKPDAILSDIALLSDMLTDLGYRIPEDIGLATTSIHDTSIDAGIDQYPEEIGRAAVRTLVSLLNERNFGIPAIRNEILIEGKWVDGSTLPVKKREA